MVLQVCLIFKCLPIVVVFFRPVVLYQYTQATSKSVQYFFVEDGAASKVYFVLVTRMYYNKFGGLCIKMNSLIMISTQAV